MALQKQIELDNGVVLNYHRITSLTKITNLNNIIEVSSYKSKYQRDKEQKYQLAQKKYSNNEELTTEEQELLEKGINVFIDTDYISIPYDEEMSIESAYEYLKATEKYKEAEDI